METGARLGPYEILSPLGAGGMGEVYRARDTRLERTVAVKVLPQHLSSSPEVRQRFEREAKTISQLSHPHICALYDVGHHDGTDYLVMEYIEGETLADRIARGALPMNLALRYGVQIAEALDTAHRRGIVHRDLKPGNVMLTKSGVKLLDFGLARAMAPASDLTSAVTKGPELTQEGAILGTVSYMAPEQLEGREADARTDNFALGATLYEMVTGQKAFTGSTRASVISAILRDEPRPISHALPSAPPGLDRVITTCLAKNPEERWQCAGDVGLQLARIAQGGTDAPRAAIRSLSSSPRWLIGLAAAGLLAAAFAALSPLRRPSSAPPAAVRFTIHPPPGTRFIWTRVQNLFAVSPDGRRLVFAARRADGRDSLWVRSLAEASAVSLAGTEGAAAPFWSHDSRFVAFFAEDKLKKVDASGGPPVTLCDAPPGFPTGSWGRGHSILFADGAGASFSVVEDGGGTPKVVLKPDPSRQEATIGWPSFLPDGRHFLYVGRSGAEKQTYVRLASVDGGATAPLVRNCSRAQYAPAGSTGGTGYLLYARDGSLMAQPFDDRTMRLVRDPVPAGLEIWQNVLIGTGPFSASDNGVLASRGNGSPARLVWLDRAGRETGSLESSAGFDLVNLSSDSRRVLVTRVNPRTGTHEVWIGDVSRSVLTRLDLGDDEYLLPIWSPDGTRLALSVGSLRHPPLLSLLPLRGRSPVALLPPGAVQFAEAWSPDGRFLLYAIRSGEQTGLWIVNLDGRREPRLLLTGVFEPVPPAHAQFSPDGRWIAFSSAESGRSEVYVTSFPEPGERVRVSVSGGSRPRWRRDARELFYVSGDNEMTATRIRLASSDVQIGAPQRLFRIDPAGWRDYDVTGDGDRFLVVVNVPAADADVIAVTTNWLSLLKR
ncbi:MAG TPA: protein kinase [Thermoanaerobaculia bacterium]|jgi:Tol biopolymer transport system component/predicted Ser/Thr protein kinase